MSRIRATTAIAAALGLLTLLAAAPASASFGYILTFDPAGSSKDEAALFRPAGLAADRSNRIYVADYGNQRVQKFDANGTWLGEFSERGLGPGQLYFPYGVAADRFGNIFVSDAQGPLGVSNRVSRFTSDGSFENRFGSSGSANGQFNRPTGLAADRSGLLSVADSYNHRVQRFNAMGDFISSFGGLGAGPGDFGRPTAVASDNAGNIYVADASDSGRTTDRIQKFSSTGAFLAAAGNRGSGPGQLDDPQGVAVDRNGDVYVADFHNDRVSRWSSALVYRDSFGSPGSGDGQFTGPSGIATDGSCNVYVGENNLRRIQKFGDMPGTTPRPCGVSLVTSIDIVHFPAAFQYRRLSGYSFQFICSRDCVAQVRGLISTSGSARLLTARSAPRQLIAGKRGKLKLKFSRRARVAIKRSLRRGHRLKLTLKITATSPTGKVTTRTRSIRLKLR